MKSICKAKTRAIAILSLLLVTSIFSGSLIGQNECTRWQFISDSDGVFNISGRKLVRYGARNSYSYRILTGQQKCDIATFGGDPAPNIHKNCDICMDNNFPADPYAPRCDNWHSIADEGGRFSISGEKLVRYGAEGAYIYRFLKGNQSCNTSTFGGEDPAPGLLKTCSECADYSLPVDGNGPSCNNWSIVSDGSRSFTLLGEKLVRYGADGVYFYRYLTGDQQCNSTTFGGDPTPNVRKTCYACEESTGQLRIVFTDVEPQCNDQWDQVADENSSFTLSTEKLVRYGANGKFYYRYLSGNQPCNSTNFGGDPAPSDQKKCYACRGSGSPVDPAPTDCNNWKLINADWNASFQLDGEKLVRYGANGKYFYKTLSGNQRCNVSTFGGDPAPGVTKDCYACMDNDTPVDPLAPKCNNWHIVADGGGTFNLAGEQLVRYGANGRFTYKILSGAQTCNNANFGGDPVPNYPKKCYQCTDWKRIGPFNTYDIDYKIAQNPPTRLLDRQVNIYCLAIAPSNADILYCVAQPGGFYRSINKGKEWSLTKLNLPFGAASDIKVHPSDPNTLYIATGSKVFKSVDGGFNFTENRDFGNVVHQLYIKRDAPQIVFAATCGGLFKSNNGGSSWNKMWDGYCWDIEAHPTNNNILYLAIKNETANMAEIYKSTDGGNNWILKNNGWNTPTLPNDQRADRGCKIGVTPAAPDKVYAGLIGISSDGQANNWIDVFVSDNAAESWAAANSNTISISQVWENYDLDVSDTDPNKIWVGGRRCPNGPVGLRHRKDPGQQPGAALPPGPRPGAARLEAGPFPEKNAVPGPGSQPGRPGGSLPDMENER